jgi:hypothetical protein
MRWVDVTDEHHGKLAVISGGEEEYNGVIFCEKLGNTPLLVDQNNEAHTFAWYWKVEIRKRKK